MRATSRIRTGVQRQLRPRWCVVFLAVLIFGAIGSAELRGESIVVEQGNQQVRTGQIRVDAGEQLVVRDANSKLDLQNHIVVDGGTIQLESGGRLNTASTNGHSRLASGGARAIVDGAGSIWTVGGYMEVGDAGEAHLLITNGGRVQSGLIPDNRSRVSGGGDGAPASTATITGAGSIWSAGSTFAVGDSGEAHLLISDGGKLESGLDGTSSRILGGGPLGEPMSSVTVTGAGSNWIAGGELAIGGTNGVRFVISQGGQVSADGASRITGGPGQLPSSAAVTDPGSIWIANSDFVIGERATLEILDGARVESGLDGRSSRVTGGGGPGTPASTAIIAGAESRWLAGGALEIGDSGEAHLTIREGAMVRSGINGDRTRVVGAGGPSSGPSTATIEGTGSMWWVGGDFVIGDAGAARLFIQEGGKVESGHGGGATRLGGGGFGAASATGIVSGQGSAWSILGEFSIDRGTLNITDGGRATSGGGGTSYLDGPGQVTISGADSTWEIQGRYLMARNGPVTTRIADGGLLSVSGDIESRSGGVLILNGGRVEAGSIGSDVQIRGDGVIDADVTSAGATIVGGSTGLLTIGGDFTQTPTASLLLELAGRGGVVGVDFDQLVVEDVATLSGSIDVSLLDNFRPALGDSFTLVRYGSVQFGNAGGVSPELRLPTLDSGLVWQPDFGPEALTISVQAVPEPTAALLAVVGLLATWIWGSKRLLRG